MNTYVVDSSVCLKWILDDEVDTQYAKNLQIAYITKKINLIAPNLWFYEVINVLKNSKLKIQIKLLENKLIDLLNSGPSLIDMSELGIPCLKHAINFDITAYDSAYITLAYVNGLTFITADDKLVKAINDPKLAISLKNFKIKTR